MSLRWWCSAGSVAPGASFGRLLLFTSFVISSLASFLYSFLISFLIPFLISVLIVPAFAVTAVSVPVFAAAVSSDPRDFETAEYFAQEGLDLINAAEAYALGYTGHGVVIAVMDTGIDARHREFFGNVIDGYDVMRDVPTPPGESVDTDGHGSHVAGIIAARRDGLGMHGVAYDALLLPVRLDTDGDLWDDFEQNIAPGWAYLASRGVSIVNNSLGVGQTWTDPGVSKDYIDATWPDTVANLRALAASGTLSVVATGNLGRSNPDILADLPNFYILEDPALEDHWLAVTAVDLDGESASYANWCGSAKFWCLAAPGGYAADSGGAGGVYSVEANGTYVREDGTSMAAPHVSAAAALVKQAFPFFEAYHLQQTLLTTATDIGDAGVDDVYGWGLLNVGKAVRGPAQLTVSMNLFRDPKPFFDVDTKGYHATFSNDISGAGKLGKKGAGVLTLLGANTYTGGTVVNGGTLVAANPSALGTGDLAIGFDGTVQLATDVAGVADVENSGTISFGTRQLSGENYTGDGGTLAITLASDGSRAALALDGAANIEQTHLTLRLVSLPAVGQRYVLVAASGGVQGRFVGGEDPRRVGAIEFHPVSNDGREVTITVAEKRFIDETADYSANQRALLKALDDPEAAGGGALLVALSEREPGSDAQKTAADQLSGDVMTVLPLAAETAADLFARHRPIPLRERGGVALGDGFSAWAGGLTSSGRTSSDGNGPGFVSHHHGRQGGAHWRFGDAGVGLTFGEANTQLTATDRGSAEGTLTSTNGALYGTYARSDWFVLGAAGYTWHQVDSRRKIEVGELESFATADFAGNTLVLEGAVARRFERGAVTVEPIIGFRTSSTRQSGFSESGPNGLEVRAASFTSRRVAFAVRVVSDASSGGTRFRSELRLGYERELGDAMPILTVRQRNMAGNFYPVVGPALGRDLVSVAVGVTVAFKDRLTLRMGLDGVWRSLHAAGMAQLALRYRW